MAIVNGTKGSVTIAGTSIGTQTKLLANKWSMSLTRQTNDITPFNPVGNARKKLAGRYQASGTIEGLLDSADWFTLTSATGDFATDAAAVAFVLNHHGGGTEVRNYNFSGILTNFTPNIRTGQPSRWTASFQMTGDLTITSTD
jgi:hypothetical protein